MIRRPELLLTHMTPPFAWPVSGSSLTTRPFSTVAIVAPCAVTGHKRRKKV